MNDDWKPCSLEVVMGSKEYSCSNEIACFSITTVGGYKREDGKRAKPPTYSPAKIEPLLDKQIPSMNVSTPAGFSTASISRCHTYVCLFSRQVTLLCKIAMITLFYRPR
jgi:hypothetical protein